MSGIPSRDYRPTARRVIFDHGTEPEYLTIVEAAEDAGLLPDVLADMIASAKVTVSWE